MSILIGTQTTDNVVAEFERFTAEYGKFERGARRVFQQAWSTLADFDKELAKLHDFGLRFRDQTGQFATRHVSQAIQDHFRGRISGEEVLRRGVQAGTLVAAGEVVSFASELIAEVRLRRRKSRLERELKTALALHRTKLQQDLDDLDQLFERVPLRGVLSLEHSIAGIPYQRRSDLEEILRRLLTVHRNHRNMLAHRERIQHTKRSLDCLFDSGFDKFIASLHQGDAESFHAVQTVRFLRELEYLWHRLPPVAWGHNPPTVGHIVLMTKALGYEKNKLPSVNDGRRELQRAILKSWLRDVATFQRRTNKYVEMYVPRHLKPFEMRDRWIRIGAALLAGLTLVFFTLL